MIAQMEVWHKHKLSSNFSPYISIFSGCGNTESPGNGCGHPKVGVANKFRACIVRCPVSPLINLATMQLAYSWLHCFTIDDTVDLLWLLMLQHRPNAPCSTIHACICARITPLSHDLTLAHAHEYLHARSISRVYSSQYQSRRLT